MLLAAAKKHNNNWTYIHQKILPQFSRNQLRGKYYAVYKNSELQASIQNDKLLLDSPLDQLIQKVSDMDFPKEITELIENDPDFEFDLVFDQNGKGGKLVTNKTLSTQYLFRVFLLPCNTESYTSVDNNYFYKNADVSELILVFDSQNSPIVLEDYEKLQNILIERAEGGIIPQELTFPHGLTPPTRWAALELQPNILPVPRYQFAPTKNTIRMQYDEKAADDNAREKRRNKDIEDTKTKIRELQQRQFELEQEIESIRRNNANPDQEKIRTLEQIKHQIQEYINNLNRLQSSDYEQYNQQLTKSRKMKSSKIVKDDFNDDL